MKNNLKYLLILIILTSVFKVQSQNNPQVKWSETVKIDKESWIKSKLIYADEKGSYIVTHDWIKKRYTITHYNENLTVASSKKMVLPKVGKKKLYYNCLVYFSNEVYVISNYTDKKEGYLYVYRNKILSSGDVDENSVLLAKIVIDHNIVRPSISTKVSEDRSKLIVRHIDRVENKKLMFDCKVVDQDFNELWENTFTLPHKSKDVSLSNFLINNNGDFFFAYNVGDDLEYNDFYILNYDMKKTSINKVELNDKQITSIKCQYNENINEVIICGFYSNKIDMPMEGLYIKGFDFYKEKYSIDELIAFTPNLFADIKTTDEVFKTDKRHEFKDFELNQIIVKKDGGYIVVGEQYWYFDGNRHFNDILALDINSTGKLIWSKIIKKKSASKVKYFLSYTFLFDSEKDIVNIIYNDNPKNLNKYISNGDMVRLNGLVTGSVAILATINSSGVLKREVLFTAKESNAIIRPLISHGTQSSILIFGFSGYKSALVKIN